MTGEWSAEDYEAAAIALAEEGKFGSAWVQLATALSSDPLHSGRLKLADAWMNEHAEALTTDQEHGKFFGVIALCARLHAQRGQATEALDSLLQVAAFRPDVPYLGWLEQWQHLSLEECDLDEVGPNLSQLVQALGPAEVADPGRRINAHRALNLVRKFLGAHPGHEQLIILEITLLRRLGEESLAVEVAVHQYEIAPSWRTAVTAANACRGVGRLDQALEYYQQATALAPEHVATHLDIGDVYVGKRQYEEALQAYTAALRLEPTNVWAKGASCIARSHLTPTSESQREARAWENHEQIGARLHALFAIKDV